ncbi:hypothetical protein EDEG_03514 [Edhazardia aedis USNM 41457]|uniref:Uncharacterized protein n=1 Tax=Edhazardia aedis (strain USNM 41457) TaxID=1003232 RepID=J8ZQP9_EDHAE|nr:hypothetical protein EDEG_03514 [Edhazardia aedis USNM 41457]|eukprot:EJW02038.1 hypothetical protein EDEG_03514 [Edhazardia aedis USNM 41457]
MCNYSYQKIPLLKMKIIKYFTGLFNGSILFFIEFKIVKSSYASQDRIFSRTLYKYRNLAPFNLLKNEKKIDLLEKRLFGIYNYIEKKKPNNSQEFLSSFNGMCAAINGIYVCLTDNLMLRDDKYNNFIEKFNDFIREYIEFFGVYVNFKYRLESFSTQIKNHIAKLVSIWKSVINKKSEILIIFNGFESTNGNKTFENNLNSLIENCFVFSEKGLTEYIDDDYLKFCYSYKISLLRLLESVLKS